MDSGLTGDAGETCKQEAANSLAPDTLRDQDSSISRPRSEEFSAAVRKSASPAFRGTDAEAEGPCDPRPTDRKVCELSHRRLRVVGSASQASDCSISPPWDDSATARFAASHSFLRQCAAVDCNLGIGLPREADFACRSYCCECLEFLVYETKFTALEGTYESEGP